MGYKEEVMEYSPGGQVEEGGFVTKPKYEEGTVFADGDGKMKDVDLGIEDDGIEEIIKETAEGSGNIDEITLQKIKRGELAGGGVAYMLGE